MDLSTLAGVAAIPVAIYYGQRTLRQGQKRARISVRVANSFPVYGEVIGDHCITIEAVNTGNKMTSITGWGVKLPGDRRMFVTRPPVETTRLPHELAPGAPPAMFWIPAEELFDLEQREGIPFTAMRPYVALSDGTEVLADKPVPLSR